MPYKNNDFAHEQHKKVLEEEINELAETKKTLNKIIMRLKGKMWLGTLFIFVLLLLSVTFTTFFVKNYANTTHRKTTLELISTRRELKRIKSLNQYWIDHSAKLQEKINSMKDLEILADPAFVKKTTHENAKNFNFNTKKKIKFKYIRTSYYKKFYKEDAILHSKKVLAWLISTKDCIDIALKEHYLIDKDLMMHHKTKKTLFIVLYTIIAYIDKENPSPHCSN